MKKAYLVLSNGKVFEGKRFGADHSALGELVFTTGVVGYTETLTDPSYFGQIVLQTFPLIGNYGVIEEDLSGTPTVSGYVVREWCDTPSNFRCQYDLDKYLKDHNIPGIYGIDTREVTRTIREDGVMGAMICDEIPADLTALKEYTVTNALASVATGKSEIIPTDTVEVCKVTVIDYGSKRNTITELTNKGCTVTVLPYNATAEEVLATDPDGILLTDGPGDPTECTEAIVELKKLIGKKPIFGISLGHQLLAIALGGETVKLKYGNRGGNQPVKDVLGRRTYITSQNHGYAVVADSLEGIGAEIFRNANDNTCEGMDYPADNAFSVQFHPETANGPHDTSFLFDRFLTNILNTKNQKAGEC